MSSEELNKKLQKWGKKARRYQNECYKLLGDRTWDYIEDKEILKQRIGFALFGIPDYSNAESSCNYNREQNDIINSVTNVLISLNKTNYVVNGFSPVCIAFIYVHLFSENMNDEGEDVLFRIPENNTEKHLFVDGNCRTYYGWDDYLENNNLPKCFMCYPLNGIYEKENGSVKIGYEKSPACKPLKALLDGLDTTSDIVSTGSACLAIASFAVPVTAPLL